MAKKDRPPNDRTSYVRNPNYNEYQVRLDERSRRIKENRRAELEDEEEEDE